MDKLGFYAEEHGLVLSPEQLESFKTYTGFLLNYNQKVNLTAITDPAEIQVKHYLDSLLALRVYDVSQAASVIDVGTGAGFPGIPMKIARKDIRLTLLDSLNKRLIFLRELSALLGQENQIVHGRAEERSHDLEFREVYSVAVSRAVASLPALVEYCLGFVKVGGCFLAFKSHEVEEELYAAGKIISLMGGETEAVQKYRLPGEIGRSLVIIRKISQTPPNYPRKRVNITKTPII